MRYADLERGFEIPPARFLPAPFWFLNDLLSPIEIRRQVRLMHEQNFGGFFLHARMGRVTPYLSDAWVECVEAAVDEAARLGMRAWFYDEDNWPSGYAGGKVLDLGQWTLARFARAVIVPVAANAEISCFDGILAAFEIRGTGDSTEVLSRLDEPALDSLSRREVPPATDSRTEAFLAFFLELHRGEREFCPEERVRGYVDVLNPAVVDAFIDSTYELYHRRLCRWFGGALAGGFFDEPEYHELGLWGGPPRFPWTQELPEAYRRDCGRDLLADLPSLLFDIADHVEIRYVYYRTLTELFSTNFTSRIAAWCEAHGIELTGHLILEEHPRQAARCIGSAMQHYLYPHIPGIDHLGKELDLGVYWSSARVLCKQAQSAARQLGREQVMCETFAGSTNYFGLSDQKWMGDWMNALGVNFLCYHAFHYSLRGYRKRDYPPTFNYQQPWFPFSGDLALHFGRLGWALSLGRRRADVLLLHPMESVWATQRDDNFTGENDWLSDALKTVSDVLLRSGYDWDFGDEEYLGRFGRVDDQTLEVGDGRYRAVVVPPAVTLRSSTLDLLESLVGNGGLVWRIEPSPALADARESQRCSALMGAIPSIGRWNRNDLSATVRAALGTSLSPQVVRSDERRGSTSDLGDVVFQERVVEGGRIFFFATAAKTPHTVHITIDAAGELLLMDTRSGELRPYPSSIDGAHTHLRLAFTLGRSYLFFVREGAQDRETAHPPVDGVTTAIATAGAPVEFSREDPNTLILDSPLLEFGGETRRIYTIEAGPLLAERAVSLPEGQRDFVASFTFESEIPLVDAFLLVETPERFSIRLDEKPISMRDEGWFVDRSLRRIVLPRILDAGRHTVALTGEWAPDVELEPIYLAGDFGVFLPASGSPVIAAEPQTITLSTITEQGFPFYAGVIAYRFSFHYTGGDCVVETGPEKTAREVLVNGHSAGTLSWPPYEVDITGYLVQGRNDLRIRAATHLRNFYGPHHVEAEESIDCFSPADHFGGARGFVRRYITRPAGLMGDIRLRITGAGG